MTENPTGGRPCTSCGAEVPEGRSVCPACSTLQRAVPQPSASPGAGSPTPIESAPPVGFAGGVPSVVSSWAPTPPPAERPKRSNGPIVAAVVVVVALVAGGAFLLTQRDEPSSDEAASATSSAPTSRTTAVPVLAGSLTHDPRSMLTWRLPGTDVASITDGIAMGEGGPEGVSKTVWTPSGDDEPGISVTIWEPSGATQATVDAFLQYRHDMYQDANAPYSGALTIASAPATVVDNSSAGNQELTAAATVDGALVVIQLVGPPGQKTDAQAFEQVVASFVHG